MIRNILLLSFMLLFMQPASAESVCADTGSKSAEKTCLTITNTALDCHNAASSDYLSHCEATVDYDVSNPLNTDAENNVRCTVEINYLKSVMGIRDTGRQRNNQTHNLAADSSQSFEMPVKFKFSTQTEASNAEIKTVNCQIDSNPQ